MKIIITTIPVIFLTACGGKSTKKESAITDSTNNQSHQQ